MSTADGLSSRMYENIYPEIDELVMVTVRQVTEMGAYVHLLEYNNIEGMVLLSELSRRRIRSVQKLMRVGKNEVVVVLRVDKEKGYIDLSKRRVSAEDVLKCEERFNKSKAVHSIMRHVAEKRNLSLEDIYQDFGWPLAKKYGHLYEAFRLCLLDPETVFEKMNIEKDTKNELVLNIARRLTPQKLKIRADIEVACFAYEGIDAVKKALIEGRNCSTEDLQLSIKLVAPPLYVMSCICIDKQLGIETMEKAISVIEESIKKNQGNMIVKRKPKAVSESDEVELTEMMKKSELENAEVAGDSDSEDI